MRMISCMSHKRPLTQAVVGFTKQVDHSVECESGRVRAPQQRAHRGGNMDKGTASHDQVTDELRKRIGDIIDHAWRDAEFRALCRTDPRQALAAHGIDLPADVSLVVVENTPDRVHLVIPPVAQDTDGGDLADDALDAVAGGVGGPVVAPVGDDMLLVFGSDGVTFTLGGR
ncbi:MAG: NHLP leader peptide family natural product precursor [Tistrella sp.]|uniref:NHLP leader peptide family natural product n=3 Tax=Geminicoccaceae TaxID=2066434 RepID=A0A3B9IID9_9PROT|nr:NHLP leader peptide family natural product precursor [Tistrella sp.]MBA75731.1 NHLP leader peptide family natural product precursor [Tistrella sp.]HAE47093.1 NHLP leader peptide family natural product precursor [Tistrella mobilis]